MSDFPGYPKQAVDQAAALAWMQEQMPKAIAWAEADLLATRRARRYHADLAVRLGRCPLGHDWRAEFRVPCGYCANAADHEQRWQPPKPALRMDPLKYATPEARANWRDPS